MTSIKITALAALCALTSLTVATPNANATPTTFTWTSTFNDLGNKTRTSNNLSFTGTFSSGDYSNSQTSNQYTASSFPLSITDYLTICETNGSSGTGTENISVSFNFIDPTGPQTGTGIIGGSIAVSGHQDDHTGAITWSPQTTSIDFTSAGETVLITLSDVKKWDVAPYNNCSGNCATVGATFTVTKDPARVPEPVSIALLGTGLVGLGTVARGRRKSALTVG